LVKNGGKGAVIHSKIYDYSTAYCIENCFGFYEKPSSKIYKIFTEKMPTPNTINCAILAF
jgi:hypothetical protein